MLASILAIIAALAVPLGLFLTWLVKRKTAAKTEIERQKRENAQAIADGDINNVLNDRLNGVPPSPNG